jgi:muconate cycloisomerase
VEHSAAERATADPIVVRVTLQSGICGYGETLPREYVTGESSTTVRRDILECMIPNLLECHPTRFSEVLEFAEQLPDVGATGQPCPAARAGVELALLDAYSRRFERPIGPEAVNWLGLTGYGRDDALDAIRVSGVIASRDPARARRRVRQMRCFGLRDFKLKVGMTDDDERLDQVVRSLEGPLRRGRASLRLDANAAWSLSEAIDRLLAWQRYPIEWIEQPLAKGDEQNLQSLRAATGWRLLHDESLCRLSDAEHLLDLGVADGFNIRISKCGGFLNALKLVSFARNHEIDVVIGCMVGQTSILSAIERHFLAEIPSPLYVESNYGRFLIADDVCRRSLRFGYGGRLARPRSPGWGIAVDELALDALTTDEKFEMPM